MANGEVEHKEFPVFENVFLAILCLASLKSRERMEMAARNAILFRVLETLAFVTTLSGRRNGFAPFSIDELIALSYLSTARS